MIIEMLIDSAVGFFLEIFSGLTGINFLADFESTFTVLFGYISDIIAYVYFFLPMDYLYPLFALVFGIIGFRIIIALVRLIVEIIPLW